MKIAFSLLAAAAFVGTIQARPIAATVKTTQNQSFECYIVTYDANGIGYSRQAAGSNPAPLSHDKIASIELDAPDGWSDANLAWNERDYATAAQKFGVLADDYANIGLFTNEYAAKSRYYQLQSLKKTGSYAELDKVIQQVRTKTPVSLDGHLKQELAMLGGWALLARKDWDGLVGFVDSYQTKSGTHPRMVFKGDLSRQQIAELSYLRGTAKIAKGDENAGLEDLQRSLAIDFGANPEIAEQAATDILKVLLKRQDDDAAMLEGYGTAVFLRDVVKGGGSIDPKFAVFLKKPESLKSIQDQKKPAPKPAAAEGAKPAPDADKKKKNP